MGTIGSTNVHYIRCIKPNEAKVAWKFEGPMVLGQLQACGVLETVKISCAGYPTRWTYEEFASRYYMLVHSDNWKSGGIRDVGLKILKATIPIEGHPRDGQKDGKDKFQLGVSKIFFRAGMVWFLSRACRVSLLIDPAVGLSRKHADNSFEPMCDTDSEELEEEVLQTKVPRGSGINSQGSVMG